MESMRKKRLRRIGLSLSVPLILVSTFLVRRDAPLGLAGYIFIALGILAVAVAVYLYVPIAAKISKGSRAYYAAIIIAMILLLTGIIGFMAGLSAWPVPLAVSAVIVTILHESVFAQANEESKVPKPASE